MYTFANDGFSKFVQPNLNQILPQINPTKILVVGSEDGVSVCYFIEKMGNITPLTIGCVDNDSSISLGVFKQNTDFALGKSLFKHTLFKTNKDSIYDGLIDQYLHEYDEFYDFIYFNFLNDTSDSLTNIIAAFKLLKVGGSIAINPYTWPRTIPEINKFNRLAIDFFVLSFADKIQVMPSLPNQIFIKKLEG